MTPVGGFGTYHPLSSFSWKAVLIALYENGTPFEPAIVDPDTREAFLKVWPIGRFPVLVDAARGEDRAVDRASDRSITLDRHHPGPAAMTPADPTSRGGPGSGTASSISPSTCRCSGSSATGSGRRRRRTRSASRRRRAGCGPHMAMLAPRGGGPDVVPRGWRPLLDWPTARPRRRALLRRQGQAVWSRRGARSRLSGPAHGAAVVLARVLEEAGPYFGDVPAGVAAATRPGLVALHNRAPASTLRGSISRRDFHGARHRRRLHWTRFPTASASVLLAAHRARPSRPAASSWSIATTTRTRSWRCAKWRTTWSTPRS